MRCGSSGKECVQNAENEGTDIHRQNLHNIEGGGVFTDGLVFFDRVR